MLGKNGVKDADIILSDGESRGGFLNDGDYHQFILDAFMTEGSGHRFEQNKIYSTSNGESGESSYNNI